MVNSKAATPPAAMMAFLDSLDPNTVLVTANQRLSRHLTELYARRQQARGASAWERPAILPWSAWVSELWAACVEALAERGEAPRAMLTPGQELALWEQVIGDTQAGAGLFAVSTAARTAQEAWRLLRAWRLPEPSIRRMASEDCLHFLNWSARFRERCEADGWIDASQALDALSEAVHRGTIRVPARVWLAGFEELTPQQKDFIESLRARSTRVEPIAAPAYNPPVVRVAAADVADEIAVAACWIRTVLGRDPHARIGIVVPDLAVRRTAIQRIFDDMLVPSAVLPGAADTPRPYNISLGVPLLDYPVAASACLILELAQEELPIERAGLLLRSPHLAGGESERTRRGLLDARLRRRGELTIAPALLGRLAAAEGDEARTARCPQLAEVLARLQRERAAVPRHQRPSRWAASFARWLEAAGWPGERTLTSEEFQTVQAWHELLEEFAALDPLLAPLTLEEALGRLRRLAAEHLFQPQSAEVPVQVLGVMETEGLDFDHLWVMGLHDELWPASPRPNPLLPASVQRKHGLPHASAERELLFARRLTARLLASASRQAVLSCPRREGDRELFPSPLILAYPEVPCETVAGERAPLYHEALQRSSSLERLHDDTAPPLPEGERVAGGSAVFRLQAACPFRAFAEVRLAAAPLEEPAVGLDARERGILLHKALECLWRALRDRARLHAMSEPALAGSVARAVDEALADMKRRRPQTFTPRFALLERERLVRLITEWLALEKTRAPFVALGHETRARFAIGGIEIDMAIDRIDTLEDGRLVVIDYKSGVPDIRDWFGERPADPQLPLYTLCCEEGGRAVAAVAYAQVRHGELAFKGVARAAGILPGVPEYTAGEVTQGRSAWDQLLQGWRGVLAELARRFRAGAAEVDPRDGEVCRHCHLHSLCRVYELEARLGRLDTEAGG